MAKAETPSAKAETKFTREQLLESAKYQNRRDVLTAVLKDGKTYSHADVERKLEEFMKGKVK